MFRNFRHMLRLARPYRRLYLLGIVALAGVDLLDTFTPKLTQWAIDHITAVSRGQAVSNPLLKRRHLDSTTRSPSRS